MNAADLMVLAPLLTIAIAAVVVLLVTAFCRRHGLVAGLTLAGLAAAGSKLAWAWPLAPRPVTALLLVDRYALFYTGLILAAAAVVVVLSYDYWEKRAAAAEKQDPPAGARTTHPRCEEYYVLLLLATAGAIVLVSSVHFASLFLGLELLSVALYGLVAYARGSALSIEAGVKYLILSGVSSAFVLFGMALIFAELGVMDFASLAAKTAGTGASGVLVLAGVCMLVVGAGFKLSLVPFHGWAPDVYQGAPAPVVAFVATVSKGAVLAAVVRYTASLQDAGALTAVLGLIAVASMFVGNLLALYQRNLKRLLAYSSIAHMGYVLVALLASGPEATLAVTFYLTAYFVTTLGAFGVVAARTAGRLDADALDDYQGLAWRHPWQAAILTAMLLSLAGIPLTAGFVGKFFVLAVGAQASLWPLVGALVVNSTIGLFYYLRVLVVMFRPDPAVAAAPAATRAAGRLASVPAPHYTIAVLCLLAAALLWLGAYPAPALRLMQAMLAGR